MTIDVRTHLPEDSAKASTRAVTEVIDGMRGSKILAIASEVRAMIAAGEALSGK